MASIDNEREVNLLLNGTIDIVGSIVESSNSAILIELSDGEDAGLAVYKPLAGERPLRDFEPGLYKRERAAFVLSEALGWGLIPSTVIREEAPFGIGSLQWFVEHDPQEHYFTLFDDAPQFHARMAQFAAFDAIANNTDRKSGHILHGLDGNLWGIDNGLCFSVDFKLRTVIWEFQGQEIPAQLLQDLAPLAESVPDELAELLTDEEAAALSFRVRRLLREEVLPSDATGMRYPWPLV